jgi:hypothetical protein
MQICTKSSAEAGQFLNVSERAASDHAGQQRSMVVASSVSDACKPVD